MASTTMKTVAPRKRNRKRKRRAISSSSSSSSSSSESESDEQGLPPRPVPTQATVQSDEPSSESSSDSHSDSDSEPDTIIPTVPLPSTISNISHQPRAPPSPSPSPPPSGIPPFLNSTTDANANKDSQEKIMKDRFRKFWMTSIAEGFKDDLEEIRKEPNLGPSRLSLLIDSLASGADIFASSSRLDKNDNINEIEVILEGLE